MTLLTYLFHICVCSCISVILYRQYLHSEYSFSSCRVMTREYKLSCVLQGHSMDVKSVTVCCEPEGALLTASRDKTARLWYRGQPASPSEGGQSYSCRKVYRGHAKYVSCAVFSESEPSEEFPSGLIYTGRQATFGHELLSYMYLPRLSG